MEIWKRNLYVCWFGVFATSTGLSQLVPILPLYMEQLGIRGTAAISEWSGLAYGITFITMAIFSPIWGRASDRYGRKPMLLRASFGMAVIVTCMGLVQSAWQLVGLRFLQGTVSGYYSAAITLVATQTPREHTGWALGTLFTGSVAGMLVGPLIGGAMAETLGIRSIFFGIGFLLVIAFATSVCFVRENFTVPNRQALSLAKIWRKIPNPRTVLAMFATTLVLQLALMSIQPILTVYIAELSDTTSYVALISGLVFASAGLASVLAGPRLGRLSDRIGAQKVILGALIAAGLLFIPQALVRNPWELLVLRFLVGVAAAGLLPSINSLIKQLTPDEIVGRIYGYNQSAQFIGSFCGSIMGGEVAAYFGIPYVFFVTSVLLLINALWVYKMVYDRT